MGNYVDNLGARMKKYEAVSKTRLINRLPVIIRIDGCHFHTFTKGFKKPFDDIFIKTMQETMKYLCENIQGCVLGYTQSDEITLVLVDYKKLDSSAWFDNEVQKITSVSAAMATVAFNKFYAVNIADMTKNKEEYKLYANKLNTAYFDSRAFNLPKEEVTNCIFWRQKDAERNSILALGQSQFSQKELQNKTCKDVMNMLENKGIIWGNLPTTKKRGSCCVKDVWYLLDDGQTVKNNSYICYNGKTGKFYFDGDGFYFFATGLKDNITCSFSQAGIKMEIKERSVWQIDNDIPIFINDNRQYIEELIFPFNEE